MNCVDFHCMKGSPLFYIYYQCIEIVKNPLIKFVIPFVLLVIAKCLLFSLLKKSDTEIEFSTLFRLGSNDFHLLETRNNVDKDNLIANISLYALTWPKLNFGSFEII